jgi:hypothetical protein
MEQACREHSWHQIRLKDVVNKPYSSFNDMFVCLTHIVFASQSIVSPFKRVNMPAKLPTCNVPQIEEVNCAYICDFKVLHL